MTPGVLLAAACAVLWWPPRRPEVRVAALVGTAESRRRMPSGWPVSIGIGVIAVVLGGIAAGVAAGIVLAVLGWRRRRQRRTRIIDAERDDLLTALSLMIAELSVGAPPARACATAAAEMSGRGGFGDGGGVSGDGRRPSGAGTGVASALSVLAGRAELGGNVVDVLDAPGGSGDSQSWRRIAVAWQTSERYGLPMADLLEAIRSDLLARKAFTERTRAGLAGPRATATVLAGLPLLGIALGQATGARPVQTLLGGGLGGILLVVGTALAAAGLVWSERITEKVVAA
ncbi:type II secretion system F family protein [Gordonia sinesedis]